MEAYQWYRQRQGIMGSKSIFDFTPLTYRQKKHMTNVYAALLSQIIMTALGVYIHLYILALPQFLIILVKVACILGIASSAPQAIYDGKVLTTQRIAMFSGYAVCTGMLLADYLYFVRQISPYILPCAFFGSISIFACFTLAAIFAEERKYLYLGSILGSAAFYLSLLSFFQIFWGGKIVHDILLWGGLLMYFGFVIFDTQVTLEDCKRGNCDCLLHALEFYVDFIGIFIRIVQILSERETEKKRKQNRE